MVFVFECVCVCCFECGYFFLYVGGVHKFYARMIYIYIYIIYIYINTVHSIYI